MKFKDIDKLLAPQEKFDGREFWNKRSEGFRAMSLKNRVGDDSLTGKVQRERKFLNEEISVLDVGCGTGRYAGFFSEKAGTYLGVDISDKMIEFAKEDNAHLGNVDFMRFDWTDDKEFEKLPKFDLVFAAMSGALFNVEALKKFSQASRKYCMIERFVNDRDSFEYLVREITGKDLFRKPHNARDYVTAIVSFVMEMGYVPEIIKDDNRNSKFSLKEEDIKDRYSYIFEQLDEKETEAVMKSVADKSNDGVISIDTYVDKVAVFWEV